MASPAENLQPTRKPPQGFPGGFGEILPPGDGAQLQPRERGDRIIARLRAVVIVLHPQNRGRKCGTPAWADVTELNTMLNKFFQMQTMMKKMGKMAKMMARMGGGPPGMLRR